jgi:hypothetical protein
MSYSRLRPRVTITQSLPGAAPAAPTTARRSAVSLSGGSPARDSPAGASRAPPGLGDGLAALAVLPLGRVGRGGADERAVLELRIAW